MALTSLWESRNPRPAVSTSLLDQAVDVVVIGGGVTGLTTALLLARAGRDVMVLEAHRVGGGTTGRSTAKLSVLQGARLAEIHARQSTEVLQQYVEANREAQAWVERFAADHGVDVQRRPDHAYANGLRGRRTARRVLDAATRAGLAAEWIDEPALPFPTQGAVRLGEQLQLDPLALVGALAREAEVHGARVVEGQRVRGVDGHGPFTVRTTDNVEITASLVVVATGMPMLDRGGFFARMSAARSYGLAFETTGREPAVDGMYLSVDTPSRSLRDAPADDGGHLLLVGGNGHPTGWTTSEVRRLDELREWTANHFPGSIETHAWSAQDYVPHHALPYAGPLLPGSDRLLVAGGYAKWGLTNGVAAALALTGHVFGKPQAWATVFRTWSPREVRGLAHAAVANGAVGARMTLGWLAPLRHPTPVTPAEGEGIVELDGLTRTPVATAHVASSVYRTTAVCTHLGGVVRWNDAERSWDCPLHGSRFGPDGSVLEGPAGCGLSRRPSSA